MALFQRQRQDAALLNGVGGDHDKEDASEHSHQAQLLLEEHGWDNKTAQWQSQGPRV